MGRGRRCGSELENRIVSFDLTPLGNISWSFKHIPKCDWSPKTTNAQMSGYVIIIHNSSVKNLMIHIDICTLFVLSMYLHI